MTKTELFQIIVLAEQYSLQKIPLNLVKPKGFKIQGLKVRTAFGLAEFGNFREHKDRTEILVFIETTKLVKFYNKWKD